MPSSVGFDGICVNEHHQNAYGLMPSPNLMAAALARRTSTCEARGAGQFGRALQPADPRRRRDGDARRDVGRAAGRGLPGRHADGHGLLLRRQSRRPCATSIAKASNSSCARGRAASRSRSTANTPSSATSIRGRVPIQKPHPPVWIPGGGSVETWEWCVEQRLPLRLPVLLRLHARPTGDGRLLGDRRQDGRRQESVSRRLPAIHRRGAKTTPRPRGFTPGRRNISTTAASTSRRDSQPAGLHQHRDHAARASPARSRKLAKPAQARM